MNAKQTASGPGGRRRATAQPLMEPLESRQLLAVGVSEPISNLSLDGPASITRYRSADYVLALGGRSGSIKGPVTPPTVISTPIGGNTGSEASSGEGNEPGRYDTADFVLYDATLFTGRPELTSDGFPQIYVTGTDMWAGRSPDLDMSKPDEAACRALARNVSGLNQMLVLDVEHWSVNLMTTAQAEVDQNLQKLAQMVDWIKDERPALKVGFYGLLPISDYWITARYGLALQNAGVSAWWDAILPPAKANYEAMQRANDYVAAVLAPRVDFVCPSFYTFYDDPETWQLVSTMRIEESRRFGKPVLPFLMMEYHDGGPVRQDMVYLSPEYWALQLETMYAHADGAVVWGGYEDPWDEQVPWWQVTRDFLAAQIWDS